MRRSKVTRRIRRCRTNVATNEGLCTQPTHQSCELIHSSNVVEVVFAQSVPKRQRDIVLGSSDLFCRMCGVSTGDIDDFTGRRARFHIELVDKGNAAPDGELSDLETLCSTCQEGSKEIATVKPSEIWLLSQIRRAGRDEQLAVLDWLRKKFKE